MRHKGDRERNHIRKQDKMGKRKFWAGRRFAKQAVIFGVIFIGLAIFVRASVSKNKRKTDILVINTIEQSIETMMVTDTETESLNEIKVDGVSITGLNKKEARETLLEYYSWNIRLKYKEQSLELKNPFPGMIDELLEEIYSKNEDGEYILDLADAKERVRSQVKDAAAKWNKNPVNAQLTGRDKDNNKWIYSDGENGIKIDEDKTADKIMSLVNQKKFNEEVEAEAVKQPPDLTASQVKEKYQVIGTFETVATNNEIRNNNIKLAVNALDGLVIYPGEAFSFNETTGNRTVERGYKPAGAYRNGEFVEEPGGGVCQVSSTLYNAIILAGIKTTERHPHSFEPSYVIPGEDAMVSYDGYSGPDLRFVNNSKTSMAIRAVFKDKKITISIVAIPILEQGITISMRSEKVKEYDPPESKYEEDQTLKLDQEIVVTPGVKGSTWKTYLITSKDGVVVTKVYFHSSTYKGKPGVVKRNPSGVVKPLETKKAEKEMTETKQEVEATTTPPFIEQENAPDMENGGTETTEGSVTSAGPGV